MRHFFIRRRNLDSERVTTQRAEEERDQREDGLLQAKDCLKLQGPGREAWRTLLWALALSGSTLVLDSQTTEL